MAVGLLAGRATPYLGGVEPGTSPVRVLIFLGIPLLAGSLIEVPVLVALVYVSLTLRRRVTP